MKVRLLRAAIADLRQTVAYIAAEDEAAAEKVSRCIEAAVDLIAERPWIGHPADSPGVREWSVPGLPYVIPYRIDGDTIEIIRIWHTSRLRPEEWK
jgi:toxin ParE1/3/4